MTKAMKCPEGEKNYPTGIYLVTTHDTGFAFPFFYRSVVRGEIFLEVNRMWPVWNSRTGRRLFQSDWVGLRYLHNGCLQVASVDTREFAHVEYLARQ